MNNNAKDDGYRFENLITSNATIYRMPQSNATIKKKKINVISHTQIENDESYFKRIHWHSKLRQSPRQSHSSNVRLWRVRSRCCSV